MVATRPAPIAPLSEIDLRLLRIFRIVAESGGLTAAESRLNMERSTISRHLKGLEQRLGGCLCLRGPTGFELTDFGRGVLAAAVQAGELLDRVRDEINRARDMLTGDLRIGLADNCLSNPACRLTDVIERMRIEAPGVRLHLVVHPPADLEHDLTARELHLCIAGTVGRNEQLVQDYLFEEEFRLYARHRSGDDRPKLARLVSDGYSIVTRRGEPHSERLAASLPEIARSMASGLESVAMLVGSGQHVGFLPTHYAAIIASVCPLDEIEAAEHLRYASPFFLSHERARPLSAPGRLFRSLVLAAHGRDAGRDRHGHSKPSSAPSSGDRGSDRHANA